MTQPYYQEVLKRELSSRVAKNPRYSLRSFAKHLGVSVSCLSRALAGDRGLSVRSASRISEAIDLSPGDAGRFLASIDDGRGGSGKRVPRTAKSWFPARSKLLDDDAFVAIAEWYHHALLELSFLRDLRRDKRAVAKELGLPLMTVELAVGRLASLGLLREVAGRLKKSSSVFWSRPESDGAKQALRAHHKQALQVAADRLDDATDTRRVTAAVTVAVDRDKLDLARQKIEQFALELTREVSSGELNDVYQLTIAYHSILNQESSK